MIHFTSILRVLSALSIAAPLALALGCSGGAGGAGHGGSGNTSSGNASSGNTSSGNTSSGNTSSGNTSSGNTARPLSWPGTWNVHLTFAIDCDYGLGNVKHANSDQTNPMTITDNGQGGLAADVTGYALAGTGSPTSLTLSGQYPAVDDTKAIADDVQADDNVTLEVGTVTDANHASGTFSGMFNGQFGETCTISQGVAAFSR